MSPSDVDFDFRKSIDLGGHILLVQFFAKTRKNLAKAELHLSNESENLHTTYSINLKYHTATHMSPSGLDFDFRKSTDLGGHIFLRHFFAKNR